MAHPPVAEATLPEHPPSLLCRGHPPRATVVSLLSPPVAEANLKEPPSSSIFSSLLATPPFYSLRRLSFLRARCGGHPPRASTVFFFLPARSRGNPFQPPRRHSFAEATLPEPPPFLLYPRPLQRPLSQSHRRISFLPARCRGNPSSPPRRHSFEEATLPEHPPFLFSPRPLQRPPSQSHRRLSFIPARCRGHPPSWSIGGLRPPRELHICRWCMLCLVRAGRLEKVKHHAQHFLWENFLAAGHARIFYCFSHMVQRNRLFMEPNHLPRGGIVLFNVRLVRYPIHGRRQF